MFALAQTLNGIIFDNKLRYTVIRQVQLTLKGPLRFTLWWCILQYLESWSRRVRNDKSTITGWDWNWDGVLLRTTRVTCWKRDIKSNPWSLTPWPNVLAKFNASFRLALNLRSLWPPTCVGLRRLAQIPTQMHASLPPFDHPTQVDTRWSQVNCMSVKFTALCDLRELARRLATHRKSVHKVWFCKLASTWFRLASGFLADDWNVSGQRKASWAKTFRF